MKQIDLKDQYFGTEIEMTGISRYDAAAADWKNVRNRAIFLSALTDSWCVKDPDGKVVEVFL